MRHSSPTVARKAQCGPRPASAGAPSRPGWALQGGAARQPLRRRGAEARRAGAAPSRAGAGRWVPGSRAGSFGGKMASVGLQFQASAGDADPQSRPLLLLGQLQHLHRVPWSHVRGKLQPRVTEEVSGPRPPCARQAQALRHRLRLARASRRALGTGLRQARPSAPMALASARLCPCRRPAQAEPPASVPLGLAFQKT